MKIAPLQKLRMAKRAFAKSLRRRRTVFRQNILFQRTGVYPYPYWNIFSPASVRNSLYPVKIPDISGIYPYLVYTCGNAFQRKPVVEMNIRHKRYFYSTFYGGNKLYRRHIGNCRADYFTARFFKLRRLTNASLNITCGNVQHRLYVNFIAVERTVSNLYSVYRTHFISTFHI